MLRDEMINDFFQHYLISLSLSCSRRLLWKRYHNNFPHNWSIKIGKYNKVKIGIASAHINLIEKEARRNWVNLYSSSFLLMPFDMTLIFCLLSLSFSFHRLTISHREFSMTMNHNNSNRQHVVIYAAWDIYMYI